MTLKRQPSVRLIQSISLLLLAVTGAGCYTSGSPTVSAKQCFELSGNDFSEALACYNKAEAARPLNYVSHGQTSEPGLTISRFELTSQSWAPDASVAPQDWKHEVSIYRPVDALAGPALLVINDGINHAAPDNAAQPPDDFTEPTLKNIALKTRTVVVSVSNVPNQYLTYSDDHVPRQEDDSVAHSWALFLKAPQDRPFIALQVPMTIAVIKTMDLVQKETAQDPIKTFTLTGASKRGWSTWLVAILDPRVTGIVPFVIDILNADKVFDHTYAVYANNWPLAFIDYYRQGVIAQRKSRAFEQLMQVQDPMRYLHSAYADRLSIPKYIVNASGDDFFLPDNTREYYAELRAEKALRVLPNTPHDVTPFIEDTLIPYLNRQHSKRAMPTITVQESERGKNSKILSLHLSEVPVKVTHWTAINRAARDFRYNCGIRYTPTALVASQNVQVTFKAPSTGWSAQFVETHYADGFVTTTDVQVLPDTYPVNAPPSDGKLCQTLPGAPGN
ncbi:MULTISPECIES: PhoPQ-activated protein PqaA family protein [unclassified Pseudomonas]|uniref:PhoPQ-activated protein PqaA family protein n=1 Tax=unclassified Pseudomonas TaxID=196821 RepID=UPI002AC8C5FB|nr:MULTISPECIES: PhoPQ-activated protein PqaA family protein [unclassified Pseudomonas]MEB0045159.1 PhoPQ-activated protein PqaA family protein [Pseudomonas sp. Dout3]MEB0096485.1 PhoPQ-activated protein PqaA family protein [Pseudomonas sp. DC1.2]WPX61437.1 PhoPQ-activated protein PqaA family protein [Pseudomonas sp. DC1.2]